jgi:hypothetical protein
MPFIDVGYGYGKGLKETNWQTASDSKTGWVYGAGLKVLILHLKCHFTEILLVYTNSIFFESFMVHKWLLNNKTMPILIKQINLKHLNRKVKVHHN